MIIHIVLYSSPVVQQQQQQQQQQQHQQQQPPGDTPISSGKKPIISTPATAPGPYVPLHPVDSWGLGTAAERLTCLMSLAKISGVLCGRDTVEQAFGMGWFGGMHLGWCETVFFG